jgi:hypothetical protein
MTIFVADTSIASIRRMIVVPIRPRMINVGRAVFSLFSGTYAKP